MCALTCPVLPLAHSEGYPPYAPGRGPACGAQIGRMMTSVLLAVRHAQSEHHIRRLTGGWTDTGLTDLGREQTRLLTARLAVELAGVPLSLYTSDLRRAVETAEPLAVALGVPMLVEPRLREHNNGAAANLTVAEATTRFPGSFDTPWGPDLRPFPGAETWREFHTRVASFLAELPADGTVPLLVTHGGTIMTIVGWWLRLDVQSLGQTWFGAHPTSITVLHADDGPGYNHRGIERLGDITHLAGSSSWDAFPLARR